MGTRSQLQAAGRRGTRHCTRHEASQTRTRKWHATRPCCAAEAPPRRQSTLGLSWLCVRGGECATMEKVGSRTVLGVAVHCASGDEWARGTAAHGHKRHTHTRHDWRRGIFSRIYSGRSNGCKASSWVVPCCLRTHMRPIHGHHAGTLPGYTRTSDHKVLHGAGSIHKSPPSHKAQAHGADACTHLRRACDTCRTAESASSRGHSAARGPLATAPWYNDQPIANGHRHRRLVGHILADKVECQCLCGLNGRAS